MPAIDTDTGSKSGGIQSNAIKCIFIADNLGTFYCLLV